MRSWVTKNPVTRLSQMKRRQPALARSQSASVRLRYGATLAALLAEELGRWTALIRAKGITQ